MDWDGIVEDVGPRLYRYFVFRGFGSQSSDLVQTVLLRLVEKVQDGTYNEREGSVRQFAFGIACHVAHEARRSDARARTSTHLETVSGFLASGSPERRDPIDRHKDLQPRRPFPLISLGMAALISVRPE
jgi:DNA-directed RNA polymerase specialized sigma24 family protein